MLWYGKRFRSMMVLASFVISTGLWSAAPVVQGVNIGESELTKKQLKEKSKALKEDLQNSKKSIKEEADKKNNLDKQIKIVKSQIDISNQYIFKLETEIEQLKIKIDLINKDMDKKIEILKESLRSIYIAGDASAIDIILQAKTFEDFLDKSELVKSVSNTISDLIDQLNSDLAQIELDKKSIEENKEAAESEKLELTKNQSELQNLLDESELILSELQTSEQQVKEQLDENDEELKRIESEIQQYYEKQRIMAERERRRREAEAEKKRKQTQKNDNQTGNKNSSSSNSGTVVSSGSLTWPVPGYYYISSDYYDTVNRGGKIHGAIDIAGGGGKSIYGARIVAADDGEVILANASGYGGGYGIYAIIDHGNGRSTLYGHMSGIAAQKGQKVKKGQVIGYVGSTGYSTGPHLHFETRSYGKKYNPMDEFKK